MDEETTEFARQFTQFVDAMYRSAQDAKDLTPLGHVVQEHLGIDLRSTDPVVQEYPVHLTVDLHRAVDGLVAEQSGRWIGVGGPQREHVDSFLEMLISPHFRLNLGPVSQTRTPVGPGEEAQVVSFGIALLEIDGVAVAALLRGPQPRYGRDSLTLDVLAAESGVGDRFLTRVRALMAEQTSFRGKVLSFQRDHFSEQSASEGLTFLARPSIPADQVVLPDGELDRIVAHVVGIGRHAELLASAGQHLKRGVLLYGPPGTGKTHVVRHLLTRTPDTTAVLLSGRTLELLPVAVKLARANQPALVVLEDCDLVAEHRGGDTNAVLFDTLEALDGLEGDADICFVMTTNRPDLLERALVERPGRVDLAVHVDRPDQDARCRLLRLYASGLPLSEAVIEETAARTAGATASLAKELVRRCVLRAADAGRTAGDEDLRAVLAELMTDAEALTRSVLGAGGAQETESAESPGTDAG